MLLKELFNWFTNLFRLKQTVANSEYYKLVFVSELPEIPSEKVVYVEGDEKLEDYWYALFKCPCGCSDNIMLNLMDDAEPRWKVSIENSDFSISPSIWKTEKCKSHFWLRNRRIIWV